MIFAHRVAFYLTTCQDENGTDSGFYLVYPNISVGVPFWGKNGVNIWNLPPISVHKPVTEWNMI